MPTIEMPTIEMPAPASVALGIAVLIMTMLLGVPDSRAASLRPVPWRPHLVRTPSAPTAARPRPPLVIDSTASCGTWSTLWPDGPPVEMSAHTMIYDPVRDRVVAYGAVAYTTQSSDVYTMDMTGTPIWTLPTIAGPSPPSRYDATAIYDSARDRMVVFGGEWINVPRNDVWALDLGTMTWTELTPTGTLPAGRSQHTAIYDAPRDRMIVFGGTTGSSVPVDEVWSLSFAGTPSWSQLAPTGTPAPRVGHTAIFDAPRNRMIVFGGYTPFDSNDYFKNDTWSLSLSGAPAWTQLAPSGALPPDRMSHAALFDAPRNRMIVFGGNVDDGSGNLYWSRDLWSLPLTGTLKWTEINPTGNQASRTSDHVIVYDSTRQRLVSYGGAAADQMWTVNLSGTASWSQIIPSGQHPICRWQHAGLLDAPRHRMVVFGGGADYTPVNDVWTFTLTGTPAWTHLATNGSGPVRVRPSVEIDSVRSRLIVFGGDDEFGVHQNDVWALTLTGTPTWTKLNPGGSDPPARSGATVIYDPGRDRMVYFGGNGQSDVLDDVWALSLSGSGSWSHLHPGGAGAAPLADGDAVALYDRPRDRMLVLTSSSDPPLRSLSFAGSATWSVVPATGAYFGPGTEATLDYVRNRIIFFFGGTELQTLPLTGTQVVSELGATTQPDLRAFGSFFIDPENDRLTMFGGYELGFSRLVNSVIALSFPGNVYALNLSSTLGGTTNAEVIQRCYDGGTVLHLTAAPDPGFDLDEWTGDASGNANPLVVTMNAHKNIVAHFGQPPPAAGSWRRLVGETVDSTPILSQESMSFDPVGHRMLVYDGAQVWQLPTTPGATDWQVVPGSAPAPYLNLDNQVYDPVRKRLIVFGARDAETWAFSLSGAPSWTMIAGSAGGPEPRYNSSTVYDPVRDRLLVYGGSSLQSSQVQYDGVWALSLSGAPSWSQLPIAGGSPDTRTKHAAIYDPVRDRMLMFGGFHLSTPLNDAWELVFGDSARWRPIVSDVGTPPSPRGSCAAIYDPIRDRVVIYGGASEIEPFTATPFSTGLDDTHVLSLRSGPFWSTITPDGALPGKRAQAPAAYDPDNDRFVISSGRYELYIPCCGWSWNYDQRTFALSLGGKYWLDRGVQNPQWGTVDVSPDADCYAPGTVVTLTAHPIAGKLLAKWGGSVDATGNPLQLVMNRDETAVAEFGVVPNVDVENSTPREFALERAAPNPFGRTMRIGYALPRATRVELRVYDAAGRRVRTLVDGEHAAGRYEAAWEGANEAGRAVGAGVYFVRMKAPGFERVQRVLRID